MVSAKRKVLYVPCNNSWNVETEHGKSLKTCVNPTVFLRPALDDKYLIGHCPVCNRKVIKLKKK